MKVARVFLDGCGQATVFLGGTLWDRVLISFCGFRTPARPILRSSFSMSPGNCDQQRFEEICGKLSSDEDENLYLIGNEGFCLSSLNYVVTGEKECSGCCHTQLHSVFGCANSRWDYKMCVHIIIVCEREEGGGEAVRRNQALLLCNAIFHPFSPTIADANNAFAINTGRQQRRCAKPNGYIQNDKPLVSVM